jgi:hypothetical protein
MLFVTSLHSLARRSACGAMDCFAPLAMTMWLLWVRHNDPTGKSAKTCPAFAQKTFRFRRRANQ